MIRILTYGEVTNDEIFSRAVPAVNVEAIVAEIIENVKTNGDKALIEYAAKFDKANLTSLQVTADELAEAVAAVNPDFLEIFAG